ncbi:MAG: NmrA family NAD(P)-binding protein [Acidobacteria bacterium]|nr:NmrA family NAD(P)-binding protein [Acidobacteriota bacterium]
MKVLVLGATGTVGGAVTRALQEQGVDVAALTRSAEKASTLPKGVEARVGDLNQPQEVGSAFKGVDGLFLLNAVTSSELQEGLFALHWAKHHAVKHLVYLSVQHTERAPHIPHFASKAMIEQAIKKSGVPHTIVQPNNFFQNDYWFKDALLQYGVYPQPLGSAGIDRVDVRDIAAAVASAFGKGPDKRTYVLGGPDSWTGESTAAIWSKHLGRPIRYAGDDLNAWETQQLQYLPHWMVFDFKIMYEHFQQHGFRNEPGERDAAEALIGKPFRTFDAFAAETAKMWNG